LISPANGAQISTNSLSFEWSHDGDWGINLAGVPPPITAAGGIGQAHGISDPYANNAGIRMGYSSSTEWDLGRGDGWAAIEPQEGVYNWSQLVPCLPVYLFPCFLRAILHHQEANRHLTEVLVRCRQTFEVSETSKVSQATCDGPPDHTYKVAYDKAAALLERLEERSKT
jgi:hypothetical protein